MQQGLADVFQQEQIGLLFKVSAGDDLLGRRQVNFSARAPAQRAISTCLTQLLRSFNNCSNAIPDTSVETIYKARTETRASITRQRPLQCESRVFI
jgi:hypothetical protein